MSDHLLTQSTSEFWTRWVLSLLLSFQLIFLFIPTTTQIRKFDASLEAYCCSPFPSPWQVTWHCGANFRDRIWSFSLSFSLILGPPFPIDSPLVFILVYVSNTWHTLVISLKAGFWWDLSSAPNRRKWLSNLGYFLIRYACPCAWATSHDVMFLPFDLVKRVSACLWEGSGGVGSGS